MSETKRRTSGRQNVENKSVDISTDLESIPKDSLNLPPFVGAAGYNRLRANFWNHMRVRELDAPTGYLEWLYPTLNEASKRDSERLYNVYLFSNIIMDRELFGYLSSHRTELTAIIEDRLRDAVLPIFEAAPGPYKNTSLNSLDAKVKPFIDLLLSVRPNVELFTN